jgi:carbonic anhydrase
MKHPVHNSASCTFNPLAAFVSRRAFGVAAFLAATLLTTAAFGLAPEHAAHAEPSHGAAPATKAPPAAAPAKPAAAAPAPAHGAAPAATPAAKPAATATPAPKESAQLSNVKPAAKPAEGKAEPKTAAKAEPEDAPVDAEKALFLLKEGNLRWLSNAPTNPNTSSQRRQAVADNGQKPFVTVLTCADSRLPVERVFDRGVGDVFVIRVAGNIAGDSETGTIEYGLGHLKTPLLVVMGHTKCGAVAAAASGTELHGKVGQLVASINPAVDRARRANPSAQGPELAALAVKENVWQTIFDLAKNSPEIRELIASGKVKVVGAVCDISNGKVEFLGEHPWQTELLAAMEKDAAPAKSATANAEPAKAGH